MYVSVFIYSDRKKTANMFKLVKAIKPCYILGSDELFDDTMSHGVVFIASILSEVDICFHLSE